MPGNPIRAMMQQNYGQIIENFCMNYVRIEFLAQYFSSKECCTVILHKENTLFLIYRNLQWAKKDQAKYKTPPVMS